MGTATTQAHGERETRPPGESERFIPRCDVRESERAYHFRVDVPGVRREDLEVVIDGNTLTIRGIRQDDGWPDDIPSRSVVAERALGEFSRSFTLLSPVEEHRVRATLHDGVLKLSVPKARAASPYSRSQASRAVG